MNGEQMKSLITFILLFVPFIINNTTAQELLAGGNMGDESAWNVVNYKTELTDYEFNYTSGGPTEGKGGCLFVTAIGSQETDIIFYQEVTLIGGTEYEIKGAFKDMSNSITNFWCEILYDTTEPPAEGDFGGNIICGFNTWDGTVAGVDGTFQDDFKKGLGPTFTAPGEAGVPTTVYFVIDVGCWLGGVGYAYDVAIDELSLMPVGGTAVEKNQSVIPDKFILHQNYPNPFNPQTTISFSIPKESIVTLKVTDAIGREVATLINNERKSAGNYEVLFNAADFTSGIYFYRIQTENYIDINKMMLLK
jgi:hypothetical protein